MAEPNRLVKMVRDRIQGQREVEYRPLGESGGPEHVLALRKKLIEEVTEYILEPSVEELADVYEVLLTLAAYDLKVSFDVVDDASRLKLRAKGGFAAAIGMYVTAKPAGVA